MPRDVDDWFVTPDDNTEVDGISIAEGFPARNVNNAMRAIMAAVRRFRDSITGRRINSGDGLSGGGDLTQNRTLNVNFATTQEILDGISEVDVVNAAELNTELDRRFRSRLIATSNGLAGGGDLSSNRLIGIVDGGITRERLADTAVTPEKLDRAYVEPSRRVNAGNGLTGGGNFNADRTLAVNFATQLQVEQGTDLSTAVSPGRLSNELDNRLASVGTGDVSSGRQINTGTGLTGGGNLTANRTISIANSGVGTTQLANASVTPVKLSQAYVPVTRRINAGAGINTLNSNGGIVNGGVDLDTNIGISVAYATQNQVTAGNATNFSIHPANLASELNRRFGLSNYVGTTQLANSSVTEDKLANSSVTEDKLANSSVTEDKLANSSVTEDKLANSSVTEDKLANGSVTRDKLADDAIPMGSNGSNNPNGTLNNIITYNSTGTYNAPDDLVRIVVDIWGGGGGGGGGGASDSQTTGGGFGGGGGGGGGGGYLRVSIVASDIPEGEIDVVVGRRGEASFFASPMSVNRDVSGGTAGNNYNTSNNTISPIGLGGSGGRSGGGFGGQGALGGIGGIGGGAGVNGASGGRGGNGADSQTVSNTLSVGGGGGGGAGGGGASAGNLGTVLVRQSGFPGQDAEESRGGSGGNGGGNGGNGGIGGNAVGSTTSGVREGISTIDDGDDGNSPGGGGGGASGGNSEPGNAGYGRIVIYEYI